MEVLVNALSVPSCRQGGAGFYTATLIEGLGRAEHVRCTALASETVAAELAQLAPATPVATAPERPLGALRKAANQAAATRRPWVLDLGFGAEPRSADLVHWPIGFMNAPPPAAGAAKILTIHDLQHEHFPQFFSRRDRLLRRIRWRPSARAADQVITISEFSRRDICERYGLSPERVTAVAQAVRPVLAAADAELPGAIRALDGRPWVLYPASPLPAKNHTRLIEAMSLLRRRGQSEVTLVLSGPIMHSWGAVKREASARRVADAVIHLGHVSDAVLARLYAETTGVIFPSLFEGFGLPVLEAMALGAPVAAAASGSLPEVMGDTGRRFDPLDPEQIAASIMWLCQLDDSARRVQAEAGRARAAGFSAERMIAETVRVYEGAA